MVMKTCIPDSATFELSLDSGCGSRLIEKQILLNISLMEYPILT